MDANAPEPQQSPPLYGDEASSKVAAFRKRRSYLDACREQSVYQEREELMAENAEIQSRIANVRKTSSAQIMAIDGGSDITPLPEQFTPYRDQVPGRLHETLNAFEATVGGAYVPLLRHLLLNTNLSGREAETLFLAAMKDNQHGI
ncbi:MAG: hypothetical protein KJ947_11565 [Alphaproteobacteria bacterium]|nr:hypothetical protein [Alphaproteobacteria bacterium]MBU1550194.1 hypothetical protein [Alphaproteobacteria bacterium]MBU2337885.1 hypothetical protein [Alphaproteobacteria bacterium]MBU2387865.1 hypothetical protein [Alphaproteobacteria bacterium]